MNIIYLKRTIIGLLDTSRFSTIYGKVVLALSAIYNFAFTYVWSEDDKVTLIGITILILADFITGIWLAIRKKEVRSSKASRSAVKLLVYLFIIAIASVIENMSGSHILEPAVCTLLASIEGISIVENLGKLGFPVPSAIISKLEMFKEEQLSTIPSEKPQTDITTNTSEPTTEQV